MTVSRRHALWFGASAPLAACATMPSTLTPLSADAIREEIRGHIETQRTAWNNGDLEGFMAFYWQDPALIFVSGANWTAGWDNALQRYRDRYPDLVAMGRLDFSNVQVTALTPDDAYVWGRWTLTRAQDQPTGMFTLIWRRLPVEGVGKRWFIVHDHSS